MNLFSTDISSRAETLFGELDALPLEERIDAINRIREALHNHSPFKGEPVDCVLWVKADHVQANNYNPNSVAPPEMKLLKHSITADGYTQPIVACQEKKKDGQYTIVDGFHRARVGKECKKVGERIHGYLPVTLIKSDRTEVKNRMAATIRHNRARGVHGVLPMVDIVADLVRRGWNDSEIAEEIGMDAEEVLRFKQNSGLPELFKSHEYSKAWE